MGEKGNVASAVGLPSEVGDTSIVSSVVNTTTEAVTSTGAGFAESLRDKATSAGVDATVEEARQRLRKDGDPPADKA
jgi:hypothetical protein